MTEMQPAKGHERNDGIIFPPATTMEVARTGLDERFAELQTNQSEMTAEVFDALRQSESGGWRSDNVAGGRTFDISKITRLQDGGMMYTAILHDRGAVSDDTLSLEEEVIEQRLKEALQHGQQIVIEYYSPEEVAIALNMNPSADLREIRDCNETSNYTFISYAGDGDFGGMRDYMIESAQAEYFETKLELFTHWREAYNYQQRAEHERGGLNERVNNAMKAIELYIDTLTKMLSRDFDCDDGLVTAGELEEALGSVPLDDYLQYAVKIKQMLDDIRNNTMTYRQSIINQIRQYDREVLSRMILAQDVRVILADFDITEIEQYRALIMERMSQEVSNNGSIASDWSVLTRLMGQLAHIAMYQNRKDEQAVGVFMRVIEEMSRKDIDTAEAFLSKDNIARSPLEGRYLGACRNLYGLRGRMKTKSWNKNVHQINDILQQLSIEEVETGPRMVQGLTNNPQDYIAHIIEETEQLHIHDVSRRLLHITGLVFDIDHKLRFVNGAPRDCSGVWNDGVVKMLNELLDVKNFRHVHDHIPGKEVAMPPGLALSLQRQALMEIFLANAHQGDRFGVAES